MTVATSVPEFDANTERPQIEACFNNAKDSNEIVVMVERTGTAGRVRWQSFGPNVPTVPDDVLAEIESILAQRGAASEAGATGIAGLSGPMPIDDARWTAANISRILRVWRARVDGLPTRPVWSCP
jgi:hypothetical protein